MAMRCVESRTPAGDYQFDVWLDDARTVPGPEEESPSVPDPAFVRSFTFGRQPPPCPTDTDPEARQTDTEYLDALRAEVKALCMAALAALEPPTVDLAQGELF